MENKHRVMIGYGFMILAYAYGFREMKTAAVVAALIGLGWNLLRTDEEKLKGHVTGLVICSAVSVTGYLITGREVTALLGILHAFTAFLSFSYFDGGNRAELCAGLAKAVTAVCVLFAVTWIGYLLTGMGTARFVTDFGGEIAGLAVPSVWVLQCFARVQKPSLTEQTAVHR